MFQVIRAVVAPFTRVCSRLLRSVLEASKDVAVTMAAKLRQSTSVSSWHRFLQISVGIRHFPFTPELVGNFGIPERSAVPLDHRLSGLEVDRRIRLIHTGATLCDQVDFFVIVDIRVARYPLETEIRSLANTDDVFPAFRFGGRLALLRTRFQLLDGTF